MYIYEYIFGNIQRCKHVRFLNTVHFVKAFFDIYSNKKMYQNISEYILIIHQNISEYISKKAFTKCTVFKKRTYLLLLVYTCVCMCVLAYWCLSVCICVGTNKVKEKETRIR